MNVGTVIFYEKQAFPRLVKYDEMSKSACYSIRTTLNWKSRPNHDKQLETKSTQELLFVIKKFIFDLYDVIILCYTFYTYYKEKVHREPDKSRGSHCRCMDIDWSHITINSTGCRI